MARLPPPLVVQFRVAVRHHITQFSLHWRHLTVGLYMISLMLRYRSRDSYQPIPPPTSPSPSCLKFQDIAWYKGSLPYLPISSVLIGRYADDTFDIENIFNDLSFWGLKRTKPKSIIVLSHLFSEWLFLQREKCNKIW